MLSRSLLFASGLRLFIGSALLVAAFALPGPALAQQAIYAPGEPIVTGFSGVVPPDDTSAAADPLDKTFIDLDGASMVIQKLAPSAPPSGQLIHSPTVFSAKARDVGQVFGIALDDADVPNIYLSATSAFGLDLVVPDADGNPVRSKTGAAGAGFMTGQWGGAGGSTGNPGSIWKVDGTTGDISLFTTIAANSGAGLGDIVFDAATQQFFVSDLDTGLIYRLGLDGTILDTFDHGTTGRPNHDLAPVSDDGSEMSITDPAFNSEDPGTWGFTQPERRVYGLAVHAGRLFYAVANGPQIWSVGINLDGSFAGDARWELDVSGLPSSNKVTNIVFDNEGRMILSQRGPQVGSYDYSVFAEPKTSSVVRYSRETPDDPDTPSTWIETPDTYAVGFRPEGANASGGIALGYGYDPNNQRLGGACNAFLWSTGDSLRDNPDLADKLGDPAIVHGLQGNDHDLVRPDNDPPFSSYFTDYDGSTDDAQNQGHVGDVEIWQQCDGGPSYGYIPPYNPPPGYTPPPGGNLTLQKSATPRVCRDDQDQWRCGFTIRVTNTGKTIYWGPVTVDDWLSDDNPGVSMKFWPQPFWNCGKTGSTEYECDYPPVELYPGESLDLHEVVTLPKRGNDICWLDNDASLDWQDGWRDANPADDHDSASARVPNRNCLPPTGDKTNLKLEKLAHPQQCMRGEKGWDCQFFIRVTNTGPGDYNAPIQVIDTLGISVPAIVSPTPPWACVRVGAQLTCDHPAQLLHPGQFVQLRVVATVPFTAVGQGLVCKLENTAKITKAPGGSPLNVNPADDQDGAVATIPSPECNPTPQKTDLSITKTGATCRPLLTTSQAAIVPGFSCGFVITIKNEGPGSFDGAITLTDTFSPALPAGSINFAPPGICVPSGSSFTCTLPATTHLAPGQTSVIFASASLPRNTQICDVRNRVSIKSPAGGTDLNTNPGNDNAQASDHVPSRLCDITPPPPKLCDLDQRRPDGSCCPNDGVWNGRLCVPPGHHQPPPVRVCPDDSHGTWPSCVCDDGTHGQPGACIPDRKPPVRFCPDDSHGTWPRCVCDDGTHGQPGACVPDRKPPVRFCPDDSHGTWPRCVCDDGTHGQPGACVPDRKPPVRFCPDDSHGTWPRCVCDDGTHGQPGACVPDRKPPVRFCPDDSHGTWPRCVCDDGTHGKPGNCVPDRRPGRHPSDNNNDNGGGIIVRPLPDGDRACPPGFVGKPPRCIPLRERPNLQLNPQLQVQPQLQFNPNRGGDVLR